MRVTPPPVATDNVSNGRWTVTGLRRAGVRLSRLRWPTGPALAGRLATEADEEQQRKQRGSCLGCDRNDDLGSVVGLHEAEQPRLFADEQRHQGGRSDSEAAERREPQRRGAKP